MAESFVEKLILYGGGLILIYYFLESWGIIQTPCDPSICTAQCPKGPRYPRGLFGDCLPNYTSCDWTQTECCCLSAQSLLHNNWNPLSEQEMNSIRLITK